MKKIRISLLGRIGLAIVIGIAIGWIVPEWGARLASTFNTVFGSFLGFMIPLIIIGFVTPAIASIGSKAGRLLIVTAALAYAATLLAGMLSYATGALTFPNLIHGNLANGSIVAAQAVEPFFRVEIPAMMAVTTALVLSFLIGLGIAYSGAKVLSAGFDEFREIVVKAIRGIVLPLLPVYIFGIFVVMTFTGEVAGIVITFSKIIVVIFILHVFILLLQYCVAGLLAGRNPLTMLRTMFPAYLTALGTQSSAATIPVTLERAVKMGVSEDIAGFVVPLCATIHMSGSTLKIVACALAMMIMQGIPYDLPMFIHFTAMLGITIIAAPGIPGGAIMASLGLLSSILGFTDAQNALMIALYIAMDSFGTACNVTGDGALAMIIDRYFGKKGDVSRRLS
ncbi:MAG: dicarboxylate/amino acid:cation symporter [Muribaculaceae bacterium]|nr:dicarboxylate/amino acid:cation symporter [Muribaculaceae bacterium]